MGGSCDFLCWLWAQVLSKKVVQNRRFKQGVKSSGMEQSKICLKALWNFIHRGCRHTNHGFAERTTNVTGDGLDAA